MNRPEALLPPGVVPIQPGPGQESVWDYPRPPRVESVPLRVRAVVDDRALADSRAAFRVLETAGAPVYYLPPADIDLDRLRENDRRTVCEWKGVATYLDYVDGERTIPSIGWVYRDPKPGYDEIRDHVAFYAARLDGAWVGDEPARPQPGGFYGGWVTDAIVGPIKGEPGSEAW